MRDVELWCGAVLVGRVSGAFQSDETWYGTIALSISTEGGALAAEIMDYVAFCEDWNERTRRGDDADPGEFERFSNVIGEGKWLARSRGGEQVIADAPVFFAGSEVTWRPAPRPE